MKILNSNLMISWLMVLLLMTPLLVSGATRLQMPPNYLTTNSALVGYWTFDGPNTPWTSATAGTTLDKSGNGNIGTLTNMNQASSTTAGKIGQALSFDGCTGCARDDVVDAGSAASFDNLSDFTMSAWVYEKSPGEGNSGAVVVKRAGNNTGWLITIASASGGIALRVDYVTTDLLVGSQNSSLPANSWHHVVVTFSSSTVQTLASNSHIIIDGQEVSYSTQNDAVGARVDDSAGNLGIGNNVTPTNATWDGFLDDVHLFNRVLTSSEISLLYESGKAKFNKSPTSFLTSGLVGYWTFDGPHTNWQSTTATDISGNGNSGSISTMSAATSPVVGKIGQALSFNGSSNLVSIPSPSNFSSSPGAPWSISAWARVDTDDGTVRVVAGYGAGSNDGDPAIGVGTSGKWIVRTRGVANTLSSNVSLTLGKWTHLVGVADSNSNIYLYVNGVLDAGPLAVTNTPTPTRSRIGANSDASAGAFFAGSIDNVRIYNRALSTDEILQLYKSSR